jgi:hypothetical protein
MKNHFEVMSGLNLVAKKALQLSGKFNSPDYARAVHESYQETWKNNQTRNDICQQWCDIQSALDDVTALMEAEGFKDIKARYLSVE